MVFKTDAQQGTTTPEYSGRPSFSKNSLSPSKVARFIKNKEELANLREMMIQNKDASLSLLKNFIKMHNVFFQDKKTL